MTVPILKQGAFLIASVQSSLRDTELIQLQTDLVVKVGGAQTQGVIIDGTPLDVMDSFASRTLSSIAQVLRLRGAQTGIGGFQPDVSVAMLKLGLTLAGV